LISHKEHPKRAMHFTSIFAITLYIPLTIATPLSAMPTGTILPTTQTIQFNGTTFNITSGHYSPELAIFDQIPPECRFEGSRGNFQYHQVTGISGTACVGNGYWTCGRGNWGDPHFRDIQSAMSALVVQDGLRSEAKAGEWTARFLWPTTAFKTRETVYFSWALAGWGVRATTYYYSRDLDFAYVETGFQNGS
jgi:hypothetical protein